MSYDFRERLKRNNSRIPVTSTPKSAKESLTITKKDVDTCFGFDASNASDEENDSSISPIAGGKKTRTYVRGNDGADSFKALLARYKQPEDDGLELHFDSAAKKTYSKKPDHDFHAEAFPHQRKKSPVRKKRSRKDKAGGSNDENPEMTKWLEEKNKEFEDLCHVPLFVRKGK